MVDVYSPNALQNLGFFEFTVDRDHIPGLKKQNLSSHDVADIINVCLQTMMRDAAIDYSVSLNKTDKANLFQWKDNIKSGFEYVDKRASGGSLWIIIGEEEGKPLIERCKALGMSFAFTEKGGRASKKRPAWYSLHS